MDWQTKLENLLASFSAGTSPKQGDIDKLISCFRTQEREELEHGLITHPIFKKWITQAITWEAPPSTPVASFSLNLAGFLSKNEQTFCDLNNNNFFIKLIKVMKVGKTPPVSLGYINLLSSFLHHNSGIEWTVASNFWEEIYDLSLSTGDEQVVEESIRFMSKILKVTIDYDESFCDGVVKKIMMPLGENIYRSLKASPDDVDICDEVALVYIKPSLKLVAHIMCHFLDGIYLGENDFGVLLLFLKNFHLEERISDFMIMAQSKCLAFYLAEIMFIMQFLELYVKRVTNSVTVTAIDATVGRIRQNFLSNLTKKEFENIFEFCHFGILYWCVLETNVPSFSNTVALSTNLTFILATCHFCLLLKYCYSSIADVEERHNNDDIRNLTANKLMKNASKDVIRICYGWRDCLVANPDIFKICIESLVYVKKSRKYFSTDLAVITFQQFSYKLKDFFRATIDHPENLEIFVREAQYFGLVFEIVRLLIEEFEIKWKDSYETVEVLDLCLDYMTQPEWPSNVMVQVLMLLNVAIVNHMSPNLALLADDATDSSVTLLGPLLYAKLRDNEVKVAALEVVHTLAALSGDKFPSLQKVLMDSELPTLVVKMSTCDGESFVRATAIKCLQEMIQVEEIWNNALRTEDLPQKMRDILLNETEGIVRVEAATFMCVAYEHQQFQKEHLDQVYETMIYSSTTDLHWEVKVRALNFWDKVIKNHLQNQGMIDDSFPNVTFSKEHRKIVTLTDSEIRKRLLKVLAQLSTIGCLGVLMSAIKDDCDMEVSKTAVKITQRLVDLFKKYNVRGDCSTPTSPAPTENGTISVSSGVSVDESMDSPRSSHPDLNEEILDQIVNSKDVSLLKNVYSPSDYGSVSNYDIQVRKVVTPNEFLQFTQQDLNSLINEKKNWLNGIEDLGSLLDDMLKTYEDDVNNMDCY